MLNAAFECLRPDWPAPTRVRAAVTTRAGGVSLAPYQTLNLGDHVGDAPAAVAENRRRVQAALHLPESPLWLKQVHGAVVASHSMAAGEAPEADASVAFEAGRVCAVLTADCLPVLLCDKAGTRVGAVHAGWRGLAGGVLEATLAAMQCPPSELLAYLGPAIGPEAFEVGEEVRQQFIGQDGRAASCFKPSPAGRWLADLYALARLRLSRLGLNAVYGGAFCTVSDPRFYSYRRERDTGRFASLIWLEP